MYSLRVLQCTCLSQVQTFPFFTFTHRACMAEMQTKHSTLPAASVAKDAEVLAFYAIWHLHVSLLKEKA